MRLRADIPSRVKLLGCYVRVYYARQPRTCYRCGFLGHQAAGCSEPAVVSVNHFREEDFPLLPVEEDSVDVDDSLAAAVPLVSPDAPPVDVAPPPEAVPPVAVASPQEVVSPSGVCPSQVAALDTPVVLLAPVCTAPLSSCSSSVVPVLGAGVAVGPPTVLDIVPRVVEDAAVLRRASVRPACVDRVSGSTSGSNDVRPVPKRSRRFSDWADVGEFDDGGSSSDGSEVQVASHSPVVAEVHVPEAASVDVSSSEVPVELASGASPASDGSGSAGECGDLEVVLKKTARSGGSVLLVSFPGSSAVVLRLLASPTISTASLSVSGVGLPSRRPSSSSPLRPAEGAVSEACVRFFHIFCLPSLCLTSLCDYCHPAPGSATSA
ncbi:uncharacterized protein [Procambarus clarkii]|uniref:uncharacterized protein n=1 Tax=Procambarus clarkii TaxID=6728 RepID=UPI0037431707